MTELLFEVDALLIYAHVLGAVFIFGTGIGTAFHGWFAHLSGDVRAIAVVSRNVVLADWIFTTPAVILQPITGFALALGRGWPLDASWLLWSVGLFLFAGACWLPVVWIQIQMAKLARRALERGEPLPRRYHRLAWIWFALGWPAFLSLLVVFHLMLEKP